MDYFSSLIYAAGFLFFLSAPSTSALIIIRHDVDDAAYIQLAARHSETDALFYLNRTDMAGTLIKPEWVLSAAHVASEINVGDSLKAKNKKYTVIDIVIHPGFREDHAYDLALIKIKNIDHTIQPVPLYERRNELHQIVYIAGNGDKGTGRSGPQGNDGRIRMATNRIEEVSEYWLKWTFDDPGDKDSNATKMEGISGPGDSSGPAFIIIDNQAYLAGISAAQSTKATNGEQGIYGVREYYVRVSSHLKWIHSVLSGDAP